MANKRNKNIYLVAFIFIYKILHISSPLFQIYLWEQDHIIQTLFTSRTNNESSTNDSESSVAMRNLIWSQCGNFLACDTDKIIYIWSYDEGRQM